MPILNPQGLNPPTSAAVRWWRLKMNLALKCNFMDFVLSVKCFRGDLWSRDILFSVEVAARIGASWRYSLLVTYTDVSQYPGCLVNNLSRIRTEQTNALYTHSCNAPWYLTTIVFHERGKHFLFVQRAGVFVILSPTHPHLIWWWCPPFSGIIHKTNLTLYKPSLSYKHSSCFLSVFSPNVNRHYPWSLVTPLDTTQILATSECTQILL